MPKLWADSLDEHRSLVRDRLVDAFVELVTEHPMDEVTVSAVAERAGIARSAVYNHVDHLHDLALLHTERVVGEWVTAFTEEDHRSAPERLASFVEASLDTFATDPIAGLDMAGHMDEERSRRAGELIAPIREALTQVVVAGVEAGELVQRDPREVAMFVWAVVSGYRPLVSSGRVDVEATAGTVIELLERAVVADDGRTVARPG